VHGAVVTGERARLSEGGLAQVAREGPHVDVPPVVHDQTGAFREDPVAVPVLADEVCHVPVNLLVKHFHFYVRARWHRFQSCVRLALHHVFAARNHHRVRHFVLLVTVNLVLVTKVILEHSGWLSLGSPLRGSLVYRLGQSRRAGCCKGGLCSEMDQTLPGL